MKLSKRSNGLKEFLSKQSHIIYGWECQRTKKIIKIGKIMRKVTSDEWIGAEKKELGWILAKRGKQSILSFDIDGYILDDVEAFVRMKQKEDKLGTAAIVESSDLHFHVYFFWKMMAWSNAQEIIQNSKIIDPLFKSFTKRNGFIRMRVTNLEKPFIKIIKSDDNIHYDLGDFYFRHYLFLVGFASETIEYYMNEVKGSTTTT